MKFSKGFSLFLELEKRDALEYGLAQGREEGAQIKTIQFAISMIQDGLSEDFVQKYTDLSFDEIAKLKEKVCDES